MPTYTHAYIYTYISIHAQIAHIHTCIHVCTNKRTISTKTHMQEHTDISIYINTHIHSYTDQLVYGYKINRGGKR